jgi:hypothetical protein
MRQLDAHHLTLACIFFLPDRMNAARARLRTKHQIAELSDEVDQYATRTTQLQQLNSELTRRVQVLTDENLILRQRLAMAQGGIVPGSLLSSVSTMSAGVVDPSSAGLHSHVVPISQQQLQERAFLQSLATGGSHSALIGAQPSLSETRMLFDSAPPPQATAASMSQSLASMTTGPRDMMMMEHQQRLLAALGQQSLDARLMAARTQHHDYPPSLADYGLPGILPQQDSRMPPRMIDNNTDRNAQLIAALLAQQRDRQQLLQQQRQADADEDDDEDEDEDDGN